MTSPKAILVLKSSTLPIYLSYDNPSPNLNAGFSESNGTSSSCFLTASIDDGISNVSFPIGLNFPNTTSSSALSRASKIRIVPFATCFRSAGKTQLEPVGLKAFPCCTHFEQQF